MKGWISCSSCSWSTEVTGRQTIVEGILRRRLEEHEDRRHRWPKLNDEEIGARFKDVWMYCMLDHHIGTLPSGPCNECIANYTLTGPPDGRWNRHGRHPDNQRPASPPGGARQAG